MWIRIMLAAGALAALLILLGCDKKPQGPLSMAAAAGNVAEVRRQLAAGAGVAGAGDPWPPLVWAARHGHIPVIRTLLEAGADPNQRDNYTNGWTPLITAIHVGQTAAARALLEAGADVNATSRGGVTPLFMAAGNGDAAMVTELLQRGADPYAGPTGGARLLASAVSGGALSDIDRRLLGQCHTETVRELLRAAPDLELPDNLSGHLARWFAEFNACSEVLAMLDSRPASPRAATLPASR